MSFTEFEYNGETFTLYHMNPFWTYIKTSNNKRIDIKVIFSHHCFTKQLQDDTPEELVIIRNGEPREICFDRLRFSFRLRDLIKQLHKYTVYHTKANSFFFMSDIDSEGNTVKYTVFFYVNRKRRNFIELYITSSHDKPEMIEWAHPVYFVNLIEDKANQRTVRKGALTRIKRIT